MWGKNQESNPTYNTTKNLVIYLTRDVKDHCNEDIKTDERNQKEKERHLMLMDQSNQYC